MNTYYYAKFAAITGYLLGLQTRKSKPPAPAVTGYVNITKYQWYLLAGQPTKWKWNWSTSTLVAR